MLALILALTYAPHNYCPNFCAVFAALLNSQKSLRVKVSMLVILQKYYFQRTEKNIVVFLNIILNFTRAKSTKSLRCNVLRILSFQQFENLKGRQEM